MAEITELSPFQVAPEGTLPSEWLAWLGNALDVADTPVASDSSLVAGWRGTFTALNHHAILPLLYLRLRDARLLPSLPPDFRDALYVAFQENALRSLAFERELERVVATLRSERVPVILLKGLATGRLVYGSLAERPIGDLDLLIPLDSMERARRVLRRLEYESIGWSGLDRVARWQHAFRSEMPMRCTLPDRAGLVTELHWSLLEIPYYIQRVDIGEVWAESSPTPGLDGASYPGPATLLIHTAAHLAMHHSRQLRLIWLLDVDRLARWSELDWEIVLARTEAWGLGRAVSVSLEAAQRWLGTPVPEAASQRLAALQLEAAGDATWGLGDEHAGRARRRAIVSWQLLDGRDRWRYAAWLGFRLLMRPLELSGRSAKRPRLETR